MDAKELVLKSLEQSQGYLDRVLDGLTQEEFAWCPSNECNSIAFTLWHTVRVEDFFVNRVIQRGKELYEAEGWDEKLGTPVKAFGYTAEELQTWPVPKMEVLIDYTNAVREKMLAYINSIAPEKLAEIPRPERSQDSIGAILGRMSTEVALHVGQIAYLRGLQRGLDK